MKISIYSASIELSYAIGFGNKFANSFPIIEQFLRVITNIANSYFNSNSENYDNIEECFLATLAISIYILASTDDIPYQYLYDFYLLPGYNNLTIYDVNILLKDTIKYNQVVGEKKSTAIKIEETTGDMIQFKKARLMAWSWPTEELSSSNQCPNFNIYSKESFFKYIALKRPPLHHFAFFVERLETSIFGKSAWRLVKNMNKNSRSCNEPNKLFDQVVTELLDNFFHYMKRVEEKMKS